MNIIILSYAFPPLNKTAAQRPYGWSKYMQEFGVKPIIVTRNWEKRRSDLEKIETGEYTLYKVNCAKTLATRYENSDGFIQKIFRKSLKYLDLFTVGSLWVGPNKELFNATCDIISKLEGPKVLIVTVQPFDFLRLGAKIHHKTGINWIADYRDDWTTSELPINDKVKKYLTKYYYPKLEKKWVSSASLISSVSRYYVNKILSLLNRPKSDGLIIQNGYFEEEFQALQGVFKHGNSSISFVYVGSLYDSQNIDIILKALNDAATPTQGVSFTFLGTAMLTNRKTFITKKYSNLKFNFYNRMPKLESLKIQKQHNYGIMCPHTELKGIPSSKLYEFLGARIPVIYYPNDNDIVDEVLQECNLGLTASSIEELTVLFKEILDDGHRNSKIGNNNILNYTRRNSTKILINGIKDHFNLQNNQLTQ